MARARNIKPGFFKNEVLGVADPLYSLLFEGLWVLADRAGRLEDRPLRIKGEIFPYRDGLNVDEMLCWLESNGFIQRYTAQGKKCILVLEFVKHQNPHKNEAESDLPAPANQGTKPEEIGTATEIIGSTRSDSLSSDSLNSDSLEEANASLSASSQPPEEDEPDDGVPPCPFDCLIDSYETALPVLPTVRRSLFAKGANGKAMRARWRWVMTAKHERGERKGERLATTAEEGRAWFKRYFDYVADSDFLSGRNGKFQSCDLGWLVTAANFEKVLSGKYHHEQREVAHA